MNPQAPDKAVRTVYFDATLRPHRSLSKLGFLIVMTLIAGTGITIGTLFFLAGAWPVLGFCGLEILLVYIAFKMNFREGRRSEHVRLSDQGLDIAWVLPSGHVTQMCWEAHWLCVDLQPRPREDNRLLLRSHGKVAEIGQFLLPGERAELAQALRDALIRYRGALV